jgi:hypothetical protein
MEKDYVAAYIIKLSQNLFEGNIRKFPAGYSEPGWNL